MELNDQASGDAAKIVADPGSVAQNTDSTWDDFKDTSDQSTQNVDTKVVADAKPAEALKTEEANAQTVDDNKPAADGAKPVAAAAAPVEVPEVAEWKTKAQKAEEIAQYYTNLYNERYNAEITAQAQTPAVAANAPAAEKEEAFKLPEGVLPPEQWKTQEDFSKYAEAVAEFKGRTHAQKLVKAEAAKLAPTFQRINQVVDAIADMVIRAQHPDYEDVTKPVIAELFNLDPAGKLLGIKNPALLQFIQHSPLPKLAMYQHGLSLKAPQNIKEATTKATTDLLKNLQSKPKVTMPASPGSGQVSQPETLDWDTPVDKVDKLLAQARLI
jgi:hypothetical protein